MSTTVESRLGALVARRFQSSIEGSERFFAANASAISETCVAMAARFERGGRLLVFGVGADATDAHHVAVEFAHPVIVGKRALPAIALTSDVASMTGARRGSLAAMIRTLGRADDIALGIACGPASGSVSAAVTHARAAGMLVIEIERDGGPIEIVARGPHHFRVPGPDAMVAQEVSETLYHVLWELVHLFLDHGVSSSAVIP